MKTNSTGLSLVEVLVATMIIAAAVFGVILSLSAQQMAEVRMRDAKVIRQLHYQIVREILKNERDATNDIGYVLSQNVHTGNNGSWNMSSPMLKDDLLRLVYTTDSNNYSIKTDLQLIRSGNVSASSSINFLYPYANANGWQNIQP